jgi:hypothetical protein
MSVEAAARSALEALAGALTSILCEGECIIVDRLTGAHVCSELHGWYLSRRDPPRRWPSLLAALDWLAINGSWWGVDPRHFVVQAAG